MEHYNHTIFEVFLVDTDLNERFRISAFLPHNSTGDNSACVLVNSGRVSKFDLKLPETDLFLDLRRKLFEMGIATFEIDFPERENVNEPASDDHIGKRYRRLVQLLSHEVFQSFATNFTLIGLSLGGQVLLRHAREKSSQFLTPHTSVMISTIIEEPTSVLANTENFHLVYGSRDFIAYIHNDAQEITPLSPNEYCKESAKHLIIKCSQKVSVDILNGLGHVLSPIVDNHDDPVNWLSTLISNANRRNTCNLPK